MSIGIVDLKLTLSDKEFKSGMKKAVGSIKSGVGQMKNILMGAMLGQYLFAGANDAIDAVVLQIQTKLNLIDQGISEIGVDAIMEIAEGFELMGYNAEVAGNTIAELIVSGKALGLKTVGIYLTKQETSFITAASAAERYAWVMENIPKKLAGMSDMLPDQIEQFIQMRKTMDDLKEAMGTTFLSVIQKITDAFGGIIPAMKTVIIAFTAYKTAIILGNVGIGISKSIAAGGSFMAPIAITMGASALLAIGAMVGGASLAISALNQVGSNNGNVDNTITASAVRPPTIVIVTDRYGQTQKALTERSGGNSSSVQTSFGSNK